MRDIRTWCVAAAAVCALNPTFAHAATFTFLTSDRYVACAGYMYAPQGPPATDSEQAIAVGFDPFSQAVNVNVGGGTITSSASQTSTLNAQSLLFTGFASAFESGTQNSWASANSHLEVSFQVSETVLFSLSGTRTGPPPLTQVILTGGGIDLTAGQGAYSLTGTFQPGTTYTLLVNSTASAMCFGCADSTSTSVSANLLIPGPGGLGLLFAAGMLRSRRQRD